MMEPVQKKRKINPKNIVCTDDQSCMQSKTFRKIKTPLKLKSVLTEHSGSFLNSVVKKSWTIGITMNQN